MAPPSLPTQVYVAINREQEVGESVRKDFIQLVLLSQLQLLVGYKVELITRRFKGELKVLPSSSMPVDV